MSFTFKQFHIDDTGCGQPVSQDAVLLGAWAKLPGAGAKGQLLDLGTGSGLLALMAAQRAPQCQVTALELDPHAAAMAQRNVSASPWEERVQIIEADLQLWQPEQGFDAIVCNPPWFTSGLRAEHSARAQARHQDTLTLAILLKHIAHWLNPGAEASLLLPCEETRFLDELLREFKLTVSRRTLVQTTPGKPPRRELLGIAHSSHIPHKDTASQCAQQTLLVRDSQNNYTPEFIALTQAFYLKL